MDNETKENNNIVEIKQLENEVIKKEVDIYCAAYMGDLNTVKECIEEKVVEVNALHDGYTALFYATQANRQRVIKYLVEKGGKESL